MMSYDEEINDFEHRSFFTVFFGKKPKKMKKSAQNRENDPPPNLDPLKMTPPKLNNDLLVIYISTSIKAF